MTDTLTPPDRGQQTGWPSAETTLETLLPDLMADAHSRGFDGLDDAAYATLEAAGFPKATAKQIQAAIETEWWSLARQGEAPKPHWMVAADVRDDVPQDPNASDAETRREALFALFDLAGHPSTLLAACHWGDAGGLGWWERRRLVSALSGDDFELQRKAISSLMEAYFRAQPSVDQAA